MKTQVLYKSRTGNTEKLAQAIFEAVTGMDKDIRSLDGQQDYGTGDLYFIGFWTDRGTASTEVLDCLESLQGKKVALFGTCGTGNSPEYYKMIEQNVSIWINDTCRYLGAYLCQGKMPLQVRKKYETMRTDENSEQIDMFIRNFDMAMTHPDTEDYQKAQEFAIACISSADSSI